MNNETLSRLYGIPHTVSEVIEILNKYDPDSIVVMVTENTIRLVDLFVTSNITSENSELQVVALSSSSYMPEALGKKK